jgi:hypothetical protein
MLIARRICACAPWSSARSFSNQRAAALCSRSFTANRSFPFTNMYDFWYWVSSKCLLLWDYRADDTLLESRISVQMVSCPPCFTKHIPSSLRARELKAKRHSWLADAQFQTRCFQLKSSKDMKMSRRPSRVENCKYNSEKNARYSYIVLCVKKAQCSVTKYTKRWKKQSNKNSRLVKNHCNRPETEMFAISTFNILRNQRKKIEIEPLKQLFSQIQRVCCQRNLLFKKWSKKQHLSLDTHERSICGIRQSWW